MPGPHDFSWSRIGRAIRNLELGFAGVGGCRAAFAIVNTNLPHFRDASNDPSTNSVFTHKHDLALRLYCRFRDPQEGGLRLVSGEDGASAGQHSANTKTPPSAPPTYEEEEGDAR